jgi:hypothetical protein
MAIWFGLSNIWVSHKIEIYHCRALFKDFSVEGPTTKRDFREKRKSGEIFPFGGSGEVSLYF